MQESEAPDHGLNWKHGVVLFAGLLIFVLLIIADKSNLNTGSEKPVSEEQAPAQGQPPMAAGDAEAPDPGPLSAWQPEAAMSDTLQAFVEAISAAPDSVAKVRAYRIAVEAFQAAGRFKDAAWHAGKLAETAPGDRNALVAGALFRNLNLLPGADPESEAYRSQSDRALHYLEMALEMAPDNEDVKMELALARLESPRGGNFQMQGVLLLREVAEQNPENAEAQFQLGLRSMQVAKFEKAKERFEAVLKTEPGRYDAKFQLALAEKELGNETAYRQLLDEVAKQNEDPALAFEARELLK